MKLWIEALKDGFKHITEFTDKSRIAKMREEGIKVDQEGIYKYEFGDHKEYELRVEPLADHEQYQIALYKNDVLLTEKLPIWIRKEPNTQT